MRTVSVAGVCLALLYGQAFASSISCDAAPVAVSTAKAKLGASPESLKRAEPFVIVAIGSSSTEGVGASRPDLNAVAWIRKSLSERFAGRRIVVHNKGIGGQNASDMVARFASDLWPLDPDLVIWQTGTNDALHRIPLERFRETLHEGIAEAHRHGVPIMLVDPQYSRALEAKVPEYVQYVEAMRAVAREQKIPLVDNYQAMRKWEGSDQGGVENLLATDRLHLNDEGHRCIGLMIANSVAEREGDKIRLAPVQRASAR